MEAFMRPFQNLLPRNPAEASKIRARLSRAGYRDQSALNIFYGARVLVPLALASLAMATGVYRFSPLFVFGCVLGIGFVAPDFWLGNRVTSRRLRIKLGLPEALDLMVICAEAGLGLDQALFRVAEELKVSQPDLGEELMLINLEQNAGRTREEALKGFATRIGLDSARSLVATLIQADTFGTSISKTLRMYSDTLRTQRRQQAEELAAKTTVKLIFPLVVFIFPSIFVVTLGPAAITFFEEFTKYFLSAT
jgi:tight adherence protein C